MTGKPWFMKWTAVNPVSKVMSTTLVVQSKRQAKAKRSHANKRATH